MSYEELPAELAGRICLEVTSQVLRHLEGTSATEVAGRVARIVVQTLQEERERALRSQLVEVCQDLALKGFMEGTSGNVSARLDPQRFLITPSGVPKGGLAPQTLPVMTVAGELLQGGAPSTEVKMHQAAYFHRPDVGAVVHAHPPYATGFAAAGIPLDTPVLPEAILVLGKVPLVEYGTPSTWELPKALEPHFEGHNVFLLANHGALALGRNLDEARHRMETLELFANVLLVSRLLGGEKFLTGEQLERLAWVSSNPRENGSR